MPARDDPCSGRLHPRALAGLLLFNEGRYFEAHEALEDAWRAEPSPVRQLYQGILQAGVAYLHISRQNYPGAVKVYGRSQRWLKLWPEVCRGVQVGQLRRDLERAIDEVRRLGPDGLAGFDLSLLKPVVYQDDES
jgi:hypothetical protein